MPTRSTSSAQTSAWSCTISLDEATMSSTENSLRLCAGHDCPAAMMQASTHLTSSLSRGTCWDWATSGSARHSVTAWKGHKTSQSSLPISFQPHTLFSSSLPTSRFPPFPPPPPFRSGPYLQVGSQRRGRGPLHQPPRDHEAPRTLDRSHGNGADGLRSSGFAPCTTPHSRENQRRPHLCGDVEAYQL